MMNEYLLFAVMDGIGTFVFALSGAMAAMQRRLDIFGVILLAFIAACGGGMLRDIMIGAVPPASLSHIRYITLSVAAALLCLACRPLLTRLAQPVALFDAIGLSLFCVTGAQKTFVYTGSVEVAIFLGMLTAIGGGLLRDIILNRIPLILQKEIYASASLLGAAIISLTNYMQWNPNWGAWIAISVCFSLRMLSLRYHWHLPYAFKSGKR